MSMSGFLVTSAAARLIGWTLVHFLWEGILIAAVLALLLEWAREKSPELRYAMTLVSLLLLPLVPLMTAISTQRSEALPTSSTAYLDLTTPKKAGLANSLSHASSSNEAIIMAVLRDASRQTGALLQGRNSVRDAVQSALPIIVSLWIFGVLVFSVRFLSSMVAVRRLLVSATAPSIDRFEEIVVRLSKRLNINTTVKIVQSAMVQVPTVAGMARPVILLPLSALTGLPQDELEMIIAHELAHIKRHDFLVNVVQNLLETLFFFHPAMWWISARLRVERELCCDDMAVSISGDPVRYARALADLEELRSHPQPALAANGGDLLFRIRRILGVEISPRDSASFLVAGSVISFLALAAIAPLAVMAMPVAPEPPVAPRPPAVISGWAAQAPLPPATPSAVITVEAKREIADGSVPSDDFTDSIIDTDSGIAVVPAVPATLALPPPAPPAPPARPLQRLVVSVPTVSVRVATPPVPAAAIAPLLPIAVARVLDRVRTVVPVTARRALATLPAIDVVRTPAPGRPARVRFLDRRDAQASPEYLQQMRAEGYELSEEDASTMSSLGISREFIEAMKEAGLSDLSPENLIGLKAVGVTPDFIARMRAAGLDDLTTENLIALQSLGVTETLVRSMSAAGFSDLSAGDLVAMKAVGITSSFIDSMKRSGIGDFDVEDLVALKSVGANGDVIAGFRSEGLDEISAEDVIGLQALRVTPEYVARLKQLGYTSLTAEDLIHLKGAGVTMKFIEEMKRQGEDAPSIDDLIEAWSESTPHRKR